jgi:SAM-dependent methyltransferase
MRQIKNNLWYNHCPLCRSSAIRQIGKINYFSPVLYSTEEVSMLLETELWKCRICNSGFVENAVPEAESISLYKQGDAEKRWSIMPFEQFRTRVVIEAFEHYLRKDISILDVGCGSGDLLDFARNKGCKTFGVEYSLASRDLVEKKGHIAFSNIKETEGLFDVITAFDLIEHLYNLPEFLKMCLDRLSSSGYLIFLTGDICCFWAQLTGSDWWYMRYPEHIIFPSKRYFELHPQLEVVDWIVTYAAPSYKKGGFSAIKSIGKALLRRDYSGLPSLSPDHTLVILKQKRVV